MKMHMKAVNTIAIATLSLPALAHSEHSNALSSLIHFMTEPDHLAISGLIATVVILTAHKMGKRRI